MMPKSRAWFTTPIRFPSRSQGMSRLHRSTTLDYERPTPKGVPRFPLWLFIGLLAIAVYPAIRVTLFKPPPTIVTRISPLRNDLSELKTVISAYRADTGQYPTQQQGLNALLL